MYRICGRRCLMKSDEVRPSFCCYQQSNLFADLYSITVQKMEIKIHADCTVKQYKQGFRKPKLLGDWMRTQRIWW